MQTTLTLDDDVVSILERLQQTHGEGLNTFVNQTLRENLRRFETPPGKGQPFRTQTVDLGKCYLDNLDNVAEVLARVESEVYR